MQYTTHILVAAIAVYYFFFLRHPPPSTLSLPSLNDGEGSARAAAIAKVAAEISNEPRNLTVGDQVFEFYHGPIASNGSLALKLRDEELANATSFANDDPKVTGGVVAEHLAATNSLEDIAALYDFTSIRLERPMSVDNSDYSFGLQRHTVKAMVLRQVLDTEFVDTKWELNDAQVATVCGTGMTWQSVRQRNLYVEDYRDAAQWNDPKTVDRKYVPNVLGFFCYNSELKQLLPLEIHYPDTGLRYTRFDSPEEWTLAKMGLNAASISYHQFQHMVETHALTVPISVELYRNMAEVHPIRALVHHHVHLDVGMERLLGLILLSPNTTLDKTWGWGATGSTRFLMHQLTYNVSMMSDFPTDIANRRVDDIPTNKYVQYGGTLYKIMYRFVQQYVNSYYMNDDAVRLDFELQNWAKACSKVPHLHEFPGVLNNREQLQKLVTHIIFQSGVKHHAMNGATTWHGLSAPYSLASLWKPMPKEKVKSGEKLNVRDFVVPSQFLPEIVGASAMFYRPTPIKESLMSAYHSAPFHQQDILREAIYEFENSLGDLDTLIDQQEHGQEHPYELLRPVHLPYHTWV